MVLAALERRWRGDTDLRFGQLLAHIVGDRSLALIEDGTLLELIGPEMRLLMPMTFPSKSKSGPPESPPTSVQSVVIVSLPMTSTRPSRSTGLRSD